MQPLPPNIADAYVDLEKREADCSRIEQLSGEAFEMLHCVHGFVVRVAAAKGTHPQIRKRAMSLHDAILRLLVMKKEWEEDTARGVDIDGRHKLDCECDECKDEDECGDEDE